MIKADQSGRPFPSAQQGKSLSPKEMGRLAAAVRLTPGLVGVHCNLFAALLALGRPAQTKVSCRAALRLKPGNAQARSNLGNAFKEMERTDG